MVSNKVTTTLQEHSGKPTTRASASVERAREPQGEPTNPEQTNRPRESHKSLREPRRAARTESQPRAKQRATAAVTTHPRATPTERATRTRTDRESQPGEPQPPQPSGMKNTHKSQGEPTRATNHGQTSNTPPRATRASERRKPTNHGRHKANTFKHSESKNPRPLTNFGTANNTLHPERRNRKARTFFYM